MRRRSFLKTLLASAMLTVGMATQTLAKPDKSEPTYLEVLREHEERAAIDLAAAFEERCWSTPTKMCKPWSILNHVTGKFENITTAEAMRDQS